MQNLDAYYFASRIEHKLKIARGERLALLGAPLAPDRDSQPASQPRRRHGWLPGFSRSAIS